MTQSMENILTSPTAGRSVTKLEESLMKTMPTKHILMLYDNAIAALNASKKAIAHGEIEARCHAVNTAIEYISELYLNLEADEDDQLINNLKTIYSHIIWQLPEVNIKNSPEKAEEAISLLSELRSSWAKLDAQYSYLQQEDDAEAREIAKASFAAASLATA